MPYSPFLESVRVELSGSTRLYDQGDGVVCQVCL